jgi:hypothetical protein
MKKLIILLIVFNSLLFGYQDLGKEGFTYKITEKDFLKELESGIKELKTEKLVEKLKKDFVVQATGEDNLSYCKQQRTKKEFDYVELPEDIYTPTGRIYKEKGSKVLAYLEQPLDICFVDGTNMIVLENQIKYFDQETKGKCVYMIANRNIMDVYKKWPERNRDMFPSKKQFEERFNVECLPTRINLIHNDRNKKEESIERFKTAE